LKFLMRDGQDRRGGKGGYDCCDEAGEEDIAPEAVGLFGVLLEAQRPGDEDRADGQGGHGVAGLGGGEGIYEDKAGR